MEEEEASTSQSSHFSRDDEDEMPWPAYSTVFDFRQNLSNEKNLAFVCKFCIGGKIIHANKSSSSNLKKHIKVCITIYLFRLDSETSSRGKFY